MTKNNGLEITNLLQITPMAELQSHGYQSTSYFNVLSNAQRRAPLAERARRAIAPWVLSLDGPQAATEPEDFTYDPEFWEKS